MTKNIAEILAEFVNESGLPISYIGRKIGISRSTLSGYIHNRLDVSCKHGKLILNFISQYKQKWAN